jgi:amino acid permease
MNKLSLSAVMLMVGTVAGASILGLPYVFAKVGFWTGVITLLLIGFAATLMSLYIGELTLRSRERHHLSGYAIQYFGKKGEYFTILIETFGLYTAVIAYLIAIGLALANIFGGSPIIFGTIFFVLASPIIFIGMTRFDKTETLISAAKFIVLLFLTGAFAFTVKPENLTGLQFGKIFFPFGIVLFACMGYTAIPKMLDIFRKREKDLMPAILISMGIVIALYFFFAYVFLGNFGNNVGEVALIGLPKFTAWGNIFVLLAMVTPFIALADAIKHIYVRDLKLDKRVSWFLAAFIPFLVYVYVKLGFVNFLQISGAYSGGILGILSGILVIKARKYSKVKPAYVVPGGNSLVYLMIALFTIGMAYQTAALLGII